MKKELKSSFRQTVVERFWYVLMHLASGDTSLAQHIYSFQNSNVWYTLPESVKNRMSTFTENNMTLDSFKSQFLPRYYLFYTKCKCINVTFICHTVKCLTQNSGPCGYLYAS